jgi:hypothetical protein
MSENQLTANSQMRILPEGQRLRPVWKTSEINHNINWPMSALASAAAAIGVFTPLLAIDILLGDPP